MFIKSLLSISGIALLVSSQLFAAELESTDWELSASHNEKSTHYAIDGDPETRWTTQKVQSNGQQFTIDLSEIQSFDKITLNTDKIPHDYPRHYSVQVSVDGENWLTVAEGDSDNSSEVMIEFDIQTARYIDIKQLGSAKRYWWSIHELSISLEKSPLEIAIDECNYTSQCKSLWGKTAYDCVNSKSEQSYCMCDGGVCADIFNNEETPLPVIDDPVVDDPVVDDPVTESPIPEEVDPIDKITNIDECNTTFECKSIWGSTANDCADSRSNQSYCMCDDGLCSDVFNENPSTEIPEETTPEEPTPEKPTEDPINTNIGKCSVNGELEQWHRVEVLCSGYDADEADDTTFSDLRFDVIFTQDDISLVVPGHFAADGNAANTGATSGNHWRAYFAAPTIGDWHYNVSFRSGSEIAVSNNDNEGKALTVFDGLSGSFNVSIPTESNKDLRNRGLLQHIVGERYLRFSGDNTIYIEGGMDSPENIFGYAEFDNTTKYDNVSSCKGILHRFDDHKNDWKAGDPVWGGSKGKSLIGLVNYIASNNVNAIYVTTNTVNGDGCDAHPWTSYNENSNVKTFDVSKLDQWEVVFDHMTENGMMIHVMTQEQENDQDLNGGDLGLERKLYYRELISRFAHHPAVQWNLGEENTNTTAQEKEFADFFKAFDPYNHQVTMHTFPNQTSKYDDLLGHDTFDGATIQVSGISTDASANGGGVYGTSLHWQQQSTVTDNPWVITFTEASGSDAPKPYSEVTEKQRVYWMWASVMSGGGGFEWYLKNAGSGHAYDLAVENLREFNEHWLQTGYLVTFFDEILQGKYGVDLQNLNPDNNITSTDTDWVLSDSSQVYVVYLREGGSTDIILTENESYEVLWMNPRTGEYTQGSNIQGTSKQALIPPTEVDQDWVAVVISKEFNDANHVDENNEPTSTYAGKDGVVIMEAENTHSDLDEWFKDTSVNGHTGSGYIEFDGNSATSGPVTSPLEYSFTVDKEGLYYLHMFVAKETITINDEARTDVANDGYVRLDGQYQAGDNVCDKSGCDADLDTLQSDTKMFGGSHFAFSWTAGNKLDLGGTGNKRVAVYRLAAGEVYTFVLSGRSKYFKVDRIMFRHEEVSSNTAQSLTLGETIN